MSPVNLFIAAAAPISRHHSRSNEHSYEIELWLIWATRGPNWVGNTHSRQHQSGDERTVARWARIEALTATFPRFLCYLSARCEMQGVMNRLLCSLFICQQNINTLRYFIEGKCEIHVTANRISFPVYIYKKDSSVFELFY